MARFHQPGPLVEGAVIELNPTAARHVQVLRMQPGHALTLFNGMGGEWQATVTRMGRSDVEVEIGTHLAVEREATVAVHLAVGMPANERMDWLVEKATELGVVSIQPLMTAHSVLRLKGERADKKQAHWQSIAVAACEQCGRNRVPVIHPVRELADWLQSAPTAARTGARQAVLSLSEGCIELGPWLDTDHRLGQDVWFLSGPEGGLSVAEDAHVRSQGWQPVTLGNRVLRAETAALAATTLAGQHRSASN
jgi:16S rRNA (uracil1498-N3)-methyltransferase